MMAVDRTGKLNEPHEHEPGGRGSGRGRRAGWAEGNGARRLMRRLRTYGQLNEGYN